MRQSRAGLCVARDGARMFHAARRAPVSRHRRLGQCRGLHAAGARFTHTHKLDAPLGCFAGRWQSWRRCLRWTVCSRTSCRCASAGASCATCRDACALACARLLVGEGWSVASLRVLLTFVSPAGSEHGDSLDAGRPGATGRRRRIAGALSGDMGVVRCLLQFYSAAGSRVLAVCLQACNVVV